MKLFSELPLLPTLHATLNEKGWVKPTEIQARALPILLDRRSVVGVSETGSGKTLSYVLPILQFLKTLENDGDPVQVESSPRAAVIVPTRELGEQVSRVFKPFTHTTRLRVRTVLGGSTFEIARRNVKGAFEVLVATPGRLVQMMDRRLISLKDVRFLVFDEADQMLDQGFMLDATRILHDCKSDRQLALFSATVSPAVQKLMTELFSEAEVIRSEGSHKVVATLTTRNCEVVDGDRISLLREVLAENVTGGTLIFTNTREQCDKLGSEVKKIGRSFVLYRGEMDKVERRRNLKSFRDGVVEILISTDLASRGLDVDHVGRVINYHLPQQIENYLHRVGRTARAGRKGVVINFVTGRDQPLIDELAGKVTLARGTAEQSPVAKGHRAPKRKPSQGPRAWRKSSSR